MPWTNGINLWSVTSFESGSYLLRVFWCLLFLGQSENGEPMGKDKLGMNLARFHTRTCLSRIDVGGGLLYYEIEMNA